jgi:L-ascorbate metabolism protein UlaG (beta-lactamase superfamily)
LLNNVLAVLTWLLLTSPAHAKIEFAWSGITNLIIKDETTTLSFDPTFTRPHLIRVLLNLSVTSDTKLVENSIDKLALKRVDAIFISHSHYDHALDFDILAKKFQAQVWGTLTTKNLGLSLGVSSSLLKIVESDKMITVGSFKITPLRFAHPKILELYEYCAGELTEVKTLPLKACDYKEGANFSYLIEHENKFYLFHQSSRTSPDFISKVKQIMGSRTLQILFQGIANRLSTQDVTDNLIKKLKPKVVVPTHFDNFFLPFNPERIDHLWGVKLEEFTTHLKHEQIEFLLPNPYQYYSR